MPLFEIFKKKRLVQATNNNGSGCGTDQGRLPGSFKMALSLKQSQAVTRLADILYDFLPGKAHPYADQSVSFAGVARARGLASFWTGGSKRPAIAKFLEGTLDQHPGQFCGLIVEIVRASMRYRASKKPITREEIDALNKELLNVQFKIPELVAPDFLANFPRATATPKSTESPPASVPVNLRALRPEFDALFGLEPKPRGFAFERFLTSLFNASGLKGRSSFRLVGEQIDGSFSLGDSVYLVEAKWEQKPLDVTPILAFSKQVEGKSRWSRGLFISYSGFTDDACTAFARYGGTNLIGISGQDLHFILEGKMSLVEAIQAKLDWAGEGRGFMVSIFELSLKK